jgi:hypothetical protein
MIVVPDRAGYPAAPKPLPAVTAYDQDNRITSATEDNSSGTAVHTTSYGHDADSNLTSQVHDVAPLPDSTYGTYTYNNLDQLSQETDAKSPADPTPGQLLHQPGRAGCHRDQAEPEQGHLDVLRQRAAVPADRGHLRRHPRLQPPVQLRPQRQHHPERRAN